MIRLITKYLAYLCVLLLIVFPLGAAAGFLSDLETTLKQELQRNIDKLNEDLQQAGNNQPDNNLVNVPLVIGETPAQAENILQEHGLVIGKVIYQKSEQAAGTIISQKPPQNAQVKKNTAVSVVVAQQQDNSKMTVVPKLIGLSVHEAQATLKQRALVLGKITEQSSQKPKGHIISQSPTAGQKIAKKSLVNIVVSKVSDVKPVVTLKLSKNPINTGETLYLSAAIKPKPESKLQYSFTMNGKVYKSNNGQLSHRFQQAGRVIITANIRQKGQKWIHSKSQALLVQASTTPPTETNNSETLITVPDVVGLPLDNAINQLKQAGLSIGNISQKITVGEAQVLQQTPKAGSRVKAGQKIDLVHSVSDKISLNLSASTTEAKAHKPLEFHAELLSNSGIRSRKYTLIVEGQRIDSSTPSWSYAFAQAGQYQVQAEADIADIGVIQSPPININVANTWVEPRAIIEPATLIVQQGDKASFISQSTHDVKSKLSLLWMDEKGGSGTASQYIIDTKGWDAGEYWVTLRVKDEQGFEHTDQAELIINKVSAEPIETTNTPEAENTMPDLSNGKLSLSASAYHATIGKPIDFTISQQPAVDANYTVIYGDGQSEETKQLWLKHSYNKMGWYFAYVISHYQDRQIQSKKIKIWILPSWLLVGASIIALALLFGIFKLLKPKANKEIRSKTLNIRYEPVIDQGRQKLERDTNSQNINAHIQFVGEKDKGTQRILRKNSERDE